MITSPAKHLDKSLEENPFSNKWLSESPNINAPPLNTNPEIKKLPIQIQT